MGNETTDKTKQKANNPLRASARLCLSFFVYVLKYTALFILAIIIIGVSCYISYPYFRSPDVVRGAPADYTAGNPADEGDILFTNNLRQKYPTGTDKTALILALRKSGFDHVTENRAYFSLRGFPCLREWSVYWTNLPDGTIADIKGRTSFTCL